MEGVKLTPISAFTAGLQAIALWLMSVLDLLAILVSVIICIVLAEFIFERAAFVRAYTVKNDSSDDTVPSLGDGNAL